MDQNNIPKNKKNKFSFFSRKKTAAPKPELTKEQRRSRTIRRLWIIFASFIGVIFLFFLLIYNGVIGYMPDVEELKNPADRFASIIYSADGEEMGRFYRNTGNRVYADYDEISQHVVNALIATEDSRFEEHSGIDFRALGRVGFKTLIMGDRSSGGGSTITTDGRCCRPEGRLSS